MRQLLANIIPRSKGYMFLLDDKSELPPSALTRRAASIVTALSRQGQQMISKKLDWTEEEIMNLPSGEHDFFERKSGQLFLDKGELLGTLSKALSAFANTGGGHIILGADNQGDLDGVPLMQGNTSTREWLEQKIPHLVSYPLADFRVHVVKRSHPTSIPAGKDVIVVDIGDSALAPHQCMHGGSNTRRYVYYYRQAGRSEPAPHFYLELLRQRLVNPALEAGLEAIIPEDTYRFNDGVFLATRLKFRISNVGRVAAYKWALLLKMLMNIPDESQHNYMTARSEYPAQKSVSRGIRMDDTLLPGCSLDEYQDLGLFLQSPSLSSNEIETEIERLLGDIRLQYQVATETSPGELLEAPIRDVLDIEALASYVVKQLNL